MSTEAELVDDLSSIGIKVSSIWDLVNGPNNYDDALPVLLKHLKSATDGWYKEGIVRALGVPRFKDATDALIEEFKSSNDNTYKWAVGNSLATIAPDNVLDKLIGFMLDKKHGIGRQTIADALGRIGAPRSVPVLLKALEDNDVAGHAIIALGKIGDSSIIKAIEPFKNHKQAWIRKAAMKAIERIEKKALKRAK